MDNAQRAHEAKRITWIGFVVNLLLTIGKIAAGIIGKSGAMIADGVHSLSDFVTDVIVILFIGVSAKGKDDNHQYGHGKFETFATMLISFALFAVAIGILWSGIEKIIASLQGQTIEKPGMIALVAALVSIIVKELLYQYTIKVGKNIDSQAVIANGWHHRSDAFSSIGTLLGISGAIFLGQSWRILDPIASIVVSFFILKVAYSLATPSIKELLEEALPKETEADIIKKITGVPGVLAYHNLKTRRNGNTYIIDVHVKLDKDISFVQSHDIASAIEVTLRSHYGKSTQICVHTEPVDSQSCNLKK